MKNKLLLIGAFMLSLTSFSQQLISTNTTWSGNVFISQQVIVQQGATLTIAPGTNVSVGYTDVDGDGVGDVKIIVNGRLKVNSNACNPVKFGPYTTTTNKKYWSGITINSNLNNDSIQGIQILNADTALKVRTGSTITSSLIENFGSVGVNFIPNIPNTILKLNNNIFINGNTAILGDSSGSKLKVDWCSVDSCTNGLVLLNGNLNITSSRIQNSSRLGLAVQDGSAKINNCLFRKNYAFGIINSSGEVQMQSCVLDSNSLGGYCIAGISTNNILSTDIVYNYGSQIEITDYKLELNTDGPIPCPFEGTSQILVNNCNILGDTTQTFVDVKNLFYLGFRPTDQSFCNSNQFNSSLNCSNNSNNESYSNVFNQGINVETIFGRLSNYNLNGRVQVSCPTKSANVSFSDQNGIILNIPNITYGNDYCVSYNWFSAPLNYERKKLFYVGVSQSGGTCGGYTFIHPCLGTYNYLFGKYGFNLMSMNVKYLFGGDLIFNNIRTTINPQFNFQSNNFGQPILSNYIFDQGSSVNYSGFTIFPINSSGIGIGGNQLKGQNFPKAYLFTSTGTDTACGTLTGYNLAVTAISGASYKWYYNGNLFQSTSTNTYQIPVAGQWSCEIITPTCTLRTGVRNIVVQQLPAISISGNTTVCQGEAVTLNASGGSNYLWSNGSTQSSITFTPSATTSINLSGNENGCTANTSVTITVNDVPNPSISPSPSAILCAGGQLQLTAAGGTNYIWSNGSNGGSINVNTAGVYTVTAINAFNCSAVSSPVTVVTVTGISVTITPSTSTICLGQSTTLTANGGSTYNWSNGSTLSNIIVSPNQTTTYSVTGTSANGCSNSAQVTVTVNPLPTASTISAGGNTTFCAGGSVTLSGNSGGTWSNGSASPSINVTTSGTYSVTNTNSCGSATSNQIAVTVNPLPTASTISAGGNTTFCAGGSVTLSGNSGGTWSNGSTSPSINVTTSGTYSVTNTNSCGSATSNQIAVTVNPLPTASTITAGGNTTICAGGSVTLSGNSGGTWSNGSTSPSINVTTSGTYSVTNTNSCGSATSNQIAVTVNPLPTASTITASGNTTICDGGSVTLSGNSGGTWSNGSASPSINVTTSGTYSVTNTNSCGSATSNQIAVTVNPLPTASTITAGGNTTFCAGGSVALSGNSGGTWSNGSASPSINVTTSGTYSVTNTNSCGSTTSNQIAVTVNPLPTASTITAGGNTTFCAGGSVTLSGNSGGTWSNGSTSPSINVTTSGTYSVTNTNSCGSTTSNQIAVTVNANPPQPVITQNGNLLTASNASTYQWQLNGVDIAGATQQQYIALQDGNYTVYITDSNSCTNSSSSLSVISTTIETLQDSKQDFIVYPNPARDELHIISISKCDIFNVKLYDVLGNEVQIQNVESGNYNNRNVYTMSIKHLQSGVYFVKLGNTMKRFVCE